MHPRHGKGCGRTGHSNIGVVACAGADWPFCLKRAVFPTRAQCAPGRTGNGNEQRCGRTDRRQRRGNTLFLPEPVRSMPRQFRGPARAEPNTVLAPVNNPILAVGCSRTTCDGDDAFTLRCRATRRDLRFIQAPASPCPSRRRRGGCRAQRYRRIQVVGEDIGPTGSAVIDITLAWYSTAPGLAVRFRCSPWVTLQGADKAALPGAGECAWGSVPGLHMMNFDYQANAGADWICRCCYRCEAMGCALRSRQASNQHWRALPPAALLAPSLRQFGRAVGSKMPNVWWNAH